MKVTKLSYGLTINLGNYQSARLDVEVEVLPNEDPNLVLHSLRANVNAEAAAIKLDLKNNPL